MSATVALGPKTHEVLSVLTEEPTTFLPLQFDDMVPIPMPPSTHPAGDQVHPWED